MTMSLQELQHTASTCTRCRLAQGRTQVVFGVGDPAADMMFIGEGPGYYEDKQGEPFVGAAGQLLTQMLAEIGLRREDVYICNVVKCLGFNALVQLGDGSWERIGRLVRARYDGLVVSVDGEGRLVPRHVVGWYASPLAGRRVFRLTYRSAKSAGGNPVSIQLTADHEVLTEDGYVPVERLRPESRIATGQGMSRLARDVVCGTLLGDGDISARRASLSFSRSGRQEAYALFKVQLLSELNPLVQRLYVAAVAGGDRVYPAVHVRTPANRALGILRREFYPLRKRVPPWMADQLNDRMLAIWFMDDGHTRTRVGGQPLAELATRGFPEQDLGILLDGLARLGLRAKASRGRLYFDTAGTRALSEHIASYVPDSMRYTLHPEVAASIPFSYARLSPEPPEVFYDDVKVEEIAHSGTDKTFFCIDVDETHNFVTAGGVVRNCRPPGNRDPLDDEIEACRPFLEGQIDLVKPKVIVTLGNFATRFILDRPVSISRVRGQRFKVDGRTVIPTFHPAAILRGGGTASSQMGALRSDFQEIRKAVEEAKETVSVAPEEQLGLF